ALARAAERGPLAVNPIIYAELCLGFERESLLEEALADAGIRRLALPYRAAWPAARAFTAYRKRGGKRTAPLPDFFIGAHVLVEGLTLLTRGARRYRTYFRSEEHTSELQSRFDLVCRLLLEKKK